MVFLLLLFAAIPKHPHWVKIKDSYRVHEMYAARYGNEIGEYYQPVKGDKYTAQCLDPKQAVFSTEQEAKRYAESCPN